MSSSMLHNVDVRRFFGAVLGVGGLGLVGYGAVKFFAGASFGDEVAIAQSVSVSLATCLIIGLVALVVGSILLLAQ